MTGPHIIVRALIRFSLAIIWSHGSRDDVAIPKVWKRLSLENVSTYAP